MANMGERVWRMHPAHDQQIPVGRQGFKRMLVVASFTSGVIALFIALLMNQSSTMDDRGDVIRVFSAAGLVTAGFVTYLLRSLRSKSFWFAPPLFLAAASIARFASTF